MILLTSKLFADYTSISNYVPSISHLKDEVNHDLVCVSDWLKYNKLTVTPDKTQVLLLNLPKSCSYSSFNFILNGVKLSVCNPIKYLGIFIDRPIVGTPYKPSCIKTIKSRGLKILKMF